MTVFGQLMLLFVFIAAGYSAFACALGWLCERRLLRRSGQISAIASVAALSALLVILIRAFAQNDFRFSYVAQYSSSTLPWHYAISALWVGQAGSLLLWSWMLGVAALLYRFLPRKRIDPSQDITFAILMTYLAFLVVIMVFGADPMEPSLSIPREGMGMSPSLQHPVMLIHPPVVFLGYALWAVPFALALSALVTGRIDRHWFEHARRWTLLAWTILGLGILLGAKWAYEELGWGGYWGWDPVENGSLMPWLTGTAMIHCGLAWHYRGLLKKTTLLLALITFALCNFAAFLTRSGIFGSLHEFSQSPIGWLFLFLMALLAVLAAVLVPPRRKLLIADSPISSLSSREACVVIAAIGWLGLALVVFFGTAAVPLSGIFLTQKITLGPAFYNRALIPVAIVLLLTTAAAPALGWGSAVKRGQRNVLWIALAGAVLAVLLGVAFGLRSLLALAITGLAAFAAAVYLATFILDVLSVNCSSRWIRIFNVLGAHRRRYGGFGVHIGFVAIAVGIAGSSLGTQKLETTMRRGQTISWAGRTIRFAELHQQEYPDKLTVEAQLEIGSPWRGPIAIRPAQNLYRLQNQWATKVAIDSSFSGDFYAILNSGRGEEQIDVTFVENPLMCWTWWGGALIGLGALVALWPARVKSTITASLSGDEKMEIHKPGAGVPPPRISKRRHDAAFNDSKQF